MANDNGSDGARWRLLARRMAAGAIDALVLTPPALLVLYLAAGEIALSGPGLIGLALVDWLYRAGMEASALQATPGKRLLRLQVGDAEGARLGLGRASLRTLPFWGGCLLALAAIEGDAGWLIAAWLAAPVCLLAALAGPQPRGLHDLLAGAVVGHAARTGR